MPVTSADLEPALGELVQGCLAVLVNRQNRMHAHARCVDAGMTAYHAPCVAEVLLVLAGHAKGRAALLAHGALQSLRFVVAEEEGAVAADYCACIISKVEADAPEGSLTLTRSTEARRKRRVIGPSKRGWVMISYQWAHQPLALALREELGRAGYSVWIDVEKMSGSIMAKMARRGPAALLLAPSLCTTTTICGDVRAGRAYLQSAAAQCRAPCVARTCLLFCPKFALSSSAPCSLILAPLFSLLFAGRGGGALSVRRDAIQRAVRRVASRHLPNCPQACLYCRLGCARGEETAMLERGSGPWPRECISSTCTRFTPVPGTRSRLVLTGRAMRKGVDVDDAR